MRTLALISLTLISCTSSNNDISAEEAKASDSLNAIINFDDSIMEYTEDSEVHDYDTTGILVTDKIGIYDVDISLQQKFISIDGKSYSLWSILESVYLNEYDYTEEEDTEYEGNHLSELVVLQNLYTNDQGGCSERSVILLKRITDFTSISYDLVFIESDSGEIRSEYQVFISNRDNTKEQTARIVNGYSLNENCETLAVEYFQSGQDKNDRWSKRILTLFITSEHFFIPILEVQLEDNADFYNDQSTINHTSTCSFEILSQKTNGLQDLQIICTTEKGNFTKIYRYNGKLYLDN